MLPALRAACLTLPLALGTAPALAQDGTDARLIQRVAGQVCARIDARLGWQRVWIEDIGDPILRVPDQKGWSVDDANYARVGAAGHSGAAARALAPYEQYKYRDGIPFGALLVQLSSDPDSLFWFDDDVVHVSLGRQKMVMFRINDTGQGDNGGSLELCIEER